MNTTGTPSEPVLHLAWSFDNTWLKELSLQLQTIYGHAGDLSENTLTVPAAMGKGYYKHWRPDPAISVIYSHLVPQSPVIIQRKVTEGPVHMLIGFNGSGHGLHFHFNHQPVYLDYMRRYAAYFNTSDTPVQIHLKAGESVRLLILLVKMDYLKQLIPSIQSATPGLFQLTPELYDTIQALDKNLHDNSADYFYVKGSIHKLLALALPAMAGNGRESLSPEAQKIIQLTDKLLQDLTRPIPHINDAAAMTGLSPSRFKSFFVKVYKQSYYSYLQGRKLEKARELLLQEKQSVTAVAYSLGYSSCSHFTRLFRKKFGITPLAYKLNGEKPDSKA